MKGYWIAHVTVTDPDQYKFYAEGAGLAFRKMTPAFSPGVANISSSRERAIHGTSSSSFHHSIRRLLAIIRRNTRKRRQSGPPLASRKSLSWKVLNENRHRRRSWKDGSHAHPDCQRNQRN